MAKYTVPGLKKSTGLSEFKPLVPGEYTLECVSCEVKEPKNPQPRDDWNWKFKVLAGPVQENGKPAKSYSHWVFVKREDHPDFDPEKTFAADEIKSMAVAAGIAVRGDDLNPESFVGTKMRATITLEPDFRDPEKMQNRVRAWKSAE